MPYRPPKIKPETTAKSRAHHKTPTAIFTKSKQSHVPPHGWTNADLRTVNGRKMLADLINAHKLAVTRGIRTLTPKLQRHLQTDLRLILKKFQTNYQAQVGVLKKNLYTVEIDVESHEDMWADAIASVLDERGMEFETVLGGAIQSTADSVNDTTVSILTGGALDDAAAAMRRPRLNRRVGQLAQQVTDITETTRTRLQRELQRAIYDDDLTVAETVRRIKDRFPEIAGNRIPTIVRTEMGRAADEGRKQGLADSGVVTHVSVIGCEAREPAPSPQYRGESTCNATNVPIEDMEQLVFHPNHTGTIVAAKFVDDEPPQEITPEGKLGRRKLDDKFDPSLSASYYRERFKEAGLNVMLDGDDKDYLDGVNRFYSQFKNSPEFVAGEFFGSASANLPDAAITIMNRAQDANRWLLQLSAEGATIQRSINVLEKRAVHDLFTLSDDVQGKGFGKELLANHLALYKQLGVEKIEVHANIDVGGYAWARYGFIPFQEEWDKLREAKQRDLRVLRKRTTYTEESLDELEVILQSDDPSSIHALSALKGNVLQRDPPLGKSLLLGSDWEGELTLSDPDSLSTFESYIGK